MDCLLSSLYYYGPLLIIVPILIVLTITQRRRAADLYQKSFRNQETIIGLLREIRDSLKQ